MAIPVQVAFDAADPHALARFWAAAMGYEVEDHTSVVDGLVSAGHLRASEVVEVDGRRGFRAVAAAADRAGAGPRLFFQAVPEPKTAKNRMHLDLHVGPDAREAERARLEGLGAVHVATHADRGAPCDTMRDPEGNEFCIE